MPIFDLGQARRRRARAAVSQASHELTQARRLVIEEVRRAHAAYLATGPIAEKVRVELVPLAELKLRQSEFQFTSGDAGLTEVLLAEQDLRTARVRLIELEQQSATSRIRLERAVGGPRAAAELSPSSPSAPPPGEESPPQKELTR
jgi:outer membrane protein TolC